jgi:signal transduction histidine kinase
MNEEARNLLNAAETGQDRFMKTLHEKGLNTFYGLPEQFTFSIENSDPLVLVIRSCVKLKLEGGEAFLITVVDLSLATRLSKEVEYLSLNERKRISRDLHDGLSQLLSSLSLQAKALSLKYQDGPESENLQEIADRAAKCMVLGTQVYRKLDEI